MEVDQKSWGCGGNGGGTDCGERFPSGLLKQKWIVAMVALSCLPYIAELNSV